MAPGIIREDFQPWGVADIEPWPSHYGATDPGGPGGHLLRQQFPRTRQRQRGAFAADQATADIAMPAQADAAMHSPLQRQPEVIRGQTPFFQQVADAQHHRFRAAAQHGVGEGRQQRQRGIKAVSGGLGQLVRGVPGGIIHGQGHRQGSPPPRLAFFRQDPAVLAAGAV